MKRARTPWVDASLGKKKRVGGDGDAVKTSPPPDPQTESVWHQVLDHDTRTRILRELDVISLVAVSIASKMDLWGTRALRGEYYVDGKRMPRFRKCLPWVAVVKSRSVMHAGYLFERRSKQSLHPTLVFRELLLDACKSFYPWLIQRNLDYAEWFARHFPPVQSADWDVFVWKAVMRGEVSLLEVLLERFYSEGNARCIEPILLLSHRAKLSRRPKEEGSRRRAYDIVNKYLRTHPVTAATLGARPACPTAIPACVLARGTAPPPSSPSASSSISSSSMSLDY